MIRKSRCGGLYQDRIEGGLVLEWLIHSIVLLMVLIKWELALLYICKVFYKMVGGMGLLRFAVWSVEIR